MVTKYQRARLDRDRAQQSREDLKRELRECKKELAAARAELERAMKVVEGSVKWRKKRGDYESMCTAANNLIHLVKEWEAGR